MALRKVVTREKRIVYKYHTIVSVPSSELAPLTTFPQASVYFYHYQALCMSQLLNLEGGEDVGVGFYWFMCDSGSGLLRAHDSEFKLTSQPVKWELLCKPVPLRS